MGAPPTLLRPLLDHLVRWGPTSFTHRPQIGQQIMCLDTGSRALNLAIGTDPFVQIKKKKKEVEKQQEEAEDRIKALTTGAATLSSGPSPSAVGVRTNSTVLARRASGKPTGAAGLRIPLR